MNKLASFSYFQSHIHPKEAASAIAIRQEISGAVTIPNEAVEMSLPSPAQMAAAASKADFKTHQVETSFVKLDHPRSVSPPLKHNVKLKVFS